MPNRSELINLARVAAAAHQLDAALVCAICEQESAWNPWAIRYEPAFFTHYVLPQLDPGKISVTEAHARAFSWGLMQVMGEVAREHGFGAASSINASVVVQNPASAGGLPANTSSPQTNSPRVQLAAAPLSQLCDPAAGLDIGCTVFAAKLSAAHNDVPRALQLYNGGANPNYSAQVLTRKAAYL